MKRTLLVLVFTWFALFLFTFPALAKVQVVVTIPDYGDLAKQVGGDHVKVTALLKPTQDPHFADATPSHLVALSRADLLVYTGMELESGWLPPLINNARNAKIANGAPGHLDVSTVIKALGIKKGMVDRAFGDIHPGGNPHFWTDPRNGLSIASEITRRLSEIDPENRENYEKGFAVFKQSLESKIAQWQEKLAPLKGTKVVVYHESWDYFLDWIGFEQAGTLEPKPGVPPSPGHVAKLIRQVKEKNVRLILQESFYPTNLSKVFADKTGAQLLVMPTMVGALPGTDSYIELIDTMVLMISKPISNQGE